MTTTEEVVIMETEGSKYSEIGYQDLRAMCKHRKLTLGRSPTIRELIKALVQDDKEGTATEANTGHTGSSGDSGEEGENGQRQVEEVEEPPLPGTSKVPRSRRGTGSSSNPTPRSKPPQPITREIGRASVGKECRL